MADHRTGVAREGPDCRHALHLRCNQADLMRTRAWRKILLSLTLQAAVACATVSASAAPNSASLYDDLGSGPGISKLVDVFVDHLFADPHISPFFDGVDPAGPRKALQAQFCDVTGGPCKTINPDMKKAHAAMDVTKGDFYAVLMLLRQSMNELGITDNVQQRLLQKLRTMQQDIVNTP